MQDELIKLIEDYSEAEEKLFSEIAQMRNYGKDCDCGGDIAMSLIDDTSKEIRKYCVECGGYADWRERK